MVTIIGPSLVTATSERRSRCSRGRISRLIWTRQRQLNQLRSTLREFYPAALEAFDDLGSGDALAVLAIAPTPTLGRGLSRSKIASALRRGRRQRRIDERAIEIQTALRAEQLEAPPVVAAAMGATVTALVAVAVELTAQIDRLETELADHFEQHPDAKIIRSLPGLGMTLGARVLGEFGDDPNRYANAKSRKNYAGTSPITRASGKHRVVLARYARNKRLADACYLWAFCRAHRQPRRTHLLRPTPRRRRHPQPGPTRARATGSSASSTAASTTARSTTNTPPGHTAPNSPLDTYDPWDV